MVSNSNNLITRMENKKPVELVQEVKNETPSFEGFMKNYEGSVNYDDLNSGSVGEARGYGPCSSSNCPQPSNYQFCLEISVVNEGLFSDFRKSYSLKSIGDVHNFHDNILYGSEGNKFGKLGRDKLAYHLAVAFSDHIKCGKNIDGWITVKESPGLFGWGEFGDATALVILD